MPAIHNPTRPNLPATIQDVAQLDAQLTEPTAKLASLMGSLTGDILLLGVAGKMGPTLARLAQRASEVAGVSRRIIGVARFSDPAKRKQLEAWGIDTIQGDLLDQAFVDSLPHAPNIIFMAGMKFGATGNASLTWAMNTLLPQAICQRYKDARIAAFSTGNVYGLAPINRGGSVETDDVNPQGEYAMSCLGRERVFEHYSRTQGTRVALLRLNYACELRYGVLVDLAQKVWQEQDIDLSMGVANVIWQGDANAMALGALADAASPPYVLNIAGPEMLSIQRVCEQLGERLGKQPRFIGEPASNAILSNGQRGHERYGYPRVPIAMLLNWVAAWIQAGGELLGKPTKFQVRDGKF